MAFKAEANKDGANHVIDVYSDTIGQFNYILSNLDNPAANISGSLNFVSPPEPDGFALGMFKLQLTGLDSGTRYSLEIDSTTLDEIETWYDIEGEDQQLLPATEIRAKTDINQFNGVRNSIPIELDGTVKDYSGNTNNGLIKNSQSLTFDGSNYVNIQSGNQISSVAFNKIEFSFWFKQSGSQLHPTSYQRFFNNTVIWQGNGAANNNLYCEFNSPSFSIEDNNWHFYKFFFDRNGITYDGVNPVDYASMIFRAWVDDEELTINTLPTENSLNGWTQGISFGNLGIARTPSSDARYVGEIVGFKITDLNNNRIVEYLPPVQGIGEIIHNVGQGSDPLSGPQNGQIINPTGNEWDNFQDVDHYLQRYGGTVSLGVGVSVAGAIIPSALTAEGDLTGFDAEGNIILNGVGNRIFDFTESLEWKTGTPITEAYVDIPPPNSPTNEYGTEDTSQSVNSKYGLFYFASGASSDVETEILKLYANQVYDAPKLIQAPDTYTLRFIDSDGAEIIGVKAIVGNEVRFSDEFGRVQVHPILGTVTATKDGFAETITAYTLKDNPSGIFDIVLLPNPCTETTPDNEHSFIRFHKVFGQTYPIESTTALCTSCPSNAQLPAPYQIQNSDKYYAPAVALGEVMSFFLNPDDLSYYQGATSLNFNILENKTLNDTGYLAQVQSSDVSGSEYIFLSINTALFPLDENKEYVLVATDNTGSQVDVIAISNPFIVISKEKALERTIALRYRNSTDFYNAKFTVVPTLFNQIRLHCHDLSDATELNSQPYQESATGITRLEGSIPRRSLSLQTLQFDKGAHNAASVMMAHDEIFINGRQVIKASDYEGSEKELTYSLWDGKMEFYDQAFSTINLYDQSN